jgi:hypothetical protein
MSASKSERFLIVLFTLLSSGLYVKGIEVGASGLQEIASPPMRRLACSSRRTGFAEGILSDCTSSRTALIPVHGHFWRITAAKFAQFKCKSCQPM